MQIKNSALPAFALLALCCQQAEAGGLMLYEIGTDNTGLANAGAAARAQGPSTIASNPAGMSYLPGTQITAGLQVLYGDLSFDRDSDTNVPGLCAEQGHRHQRQLGLGVAGRHAGGPDQVPLRRSNFRSIRQCLDSSGDRKQTWRF